MYCGNEHAQRVVQSIQRHEEKVGLYKIPAETEEAAFEEEKRLIALYGRLDLGTGTLCNLTDGGEGPSLSNTTKEKMGLARLGSKRSQETREKMRASQLGKKHSPETKEKLRVRALGRKHSLEAREKIGIASLGRHLGKTRSSETREKLRVAHLGQNPWNKPPDSFNLSTLPSPKESK